jgi:GGDEF domain-containing protein
MFGGMDMSTLTIQLPDDTTQRLKTLAQSRCLSMNKLVEQLDAVCVGLGKPFPRYGDHGECTKGGGCAGQTGRRGCTAQAVTPLPHPCPLRLNFSAGTVQLATDEKGVVVIKSADEAMYLAKRSGKNRAVGA